MADTKEKHPRASNGRFVKRARSSSKKAGKPAAQGSAQSVAASDGSDAGRSGRSLQREGSIRLALLTLAILCAALGFALSFFWIAALVLMGILWGAMLAERPQRQATVTGLVSEMVTAVVDEAKDVMDATPGSHSTSATQPAVADEER
jgi:hypothetical protein